jgi:hypothetical protein
MDESALVTALNNLENSWSSVDGWLNFWTWLVVIGVAFELLVLAKEYSDERRDFKRGTIHSPEKPSKLAYGVGFLGTVLVVGGVSGELRLHVRAGEIEVKMREASRKLVALVNARATKLAIDLELEKQKTAIFEKQANQARSALEAQPPGDGFPPENATIAGHSPLHREWPLDIIEAEREDTNSRKCFEGEMSIAIDPGPASSALVVWNGARSIVQLARYVSNQAILDLLRTWAPQSHDSMVIEQVA